MHGLLTIGILTLTPRAHSAERPTLAVVGVHQPGLGAEDQGHTIRALVRAIDETGRFDGLTIDEVAVRIRGRERVIVEEGLLDGALEKLDAGKGLYHQALPDGALFALQTAVGELLRAMPATNRVTDLWEAWVYIGTCHLYATAPNEAAAHVAFQNAAALMPQRPLNAALFPPNVVDAYEQERAYLSLFPVGLEVRTDSPATVWVDGVERGTAPVTVRGLLPGEHHVVARGEGTLGYAILSTDVPTPQGGTPPSQRPPRFVDLQVAMRVPVLGQASDSRVGRSQQTGALYHALGDRAADVDYVLMVGTDAEVLYLQLLDARNDALSSTIEVPYAGDADNEAVAALPRLLAFVGRDDRLASVSGAAAPLDVGANSALAVLLLQPQDYSNRLAPSASKKRRRRTATAVAAFVLAGAAATGGYVYLSSQP